MNYSRSIPHRFGLAFLGVFCCVLTASAQDDGLVFDTHGFWENAGELVQQCQENWNDIQDELNRYSSALESKDKSVVDVRTIGKTYAKAQNVLRDGQMLVEMGEPAGIDFTFRGNEATKLIEQVSELMRGEDATTKLMGQAKSYSERGSAKRGKAVQKMDDLIAKSKLEEAEQELRELLSDIDTFILWLAPRDAVNVRQQYARTGKTIDNAMTRIRTDKTMERVSERILASKLDLEGLVDQANQVARDIQASGSATLAGNPVNGAEAFSQLCLQWEAEHGKMLNCMGMAYAVKEKLNYPLKDLFGEKSAATNWTDAGFELHANMQAALVSIIQADAGKVSTNDLPDRYAQYVNAVGYMSSRVSDKAFVEACGKALAELAKKDSAFESQVENYRKATDDMLTWRNKIAESKSKTKLKEYLAPDRIVGQQKLVPRLTTGLPMGMAELQPHVGKKTSLSAVFGLTEEASFAGATNRFWTGIKGNLASQDHQQKLLEDLYLADGKSPLTIRAADAILSARNNHYQLIGGEIESFHPDSLSVRLAKLPTKMATFYLVGDLPKDKADLDDTLMRITIRPQWLQHEYYFVELK